MGLEIVSLDGVISIHSMLVLVPDVFSQVPLPVKDLSAAFAWTFEVALLLALELLNVCFE